ncbi:MAG: hypothetical protein TUN42_01710 [Dehalogenimonas sp.]
MAREMTHCFVKIPVKRLDDDNLDKVRSLERKLGLQLIAFNSDRSEYAELDENQLREIETLGKEIDATIVAYKSLRSPTPRAPAC